MFDFSGMMTSVWVIVIVSTVIPLALVGFIIWLVVSKLSKASQERNRLLSEGVAAPATIINVWDTGLYVNNRRQIGILLKVFPPNGNWFQTKAEQLISDLQIPQFQPGTTVDVRYDPYDTSKVTIAATMLRQ